MFTNISTFTYAIGHISVADNQDLWLTQTNSLIGSDVVSLWGKIQSSELLCVVMELRKTFYDEESGLEINDGPMVRGQ